MKIKISDLSRMMCIDFTQVNADGTTTTEKNSSRLAIPTEQLDSENAEILKQCDRT